MNLKDLASRNTNTILLKHSTKCQEANMSSYSYRISRSASRKGFLLKTKMKQNKNPRGINSLAAASVPQLDHCPAAAEARGAH